MVYSASNRKQSYDTIQIAQIKKLENSFLELIIFLSMGGVNALNIN